MKIVNTHKLFIIILIINSLISFSAYAHETRGLISYNETKAFQGYTLFSPLHVRTTYLIDMNGNLIHSWESDYLPGLSVYLLENGNLLRTGKTSNETTGGNNFIQLGYGGIIQEIDWDGNIVWEYVYSSPKYRQHHDVERLPNGNTLFIAWEFKTNQETRAAGRDVSILVFDPLWPTVIIEVNADKEIVWEWHAWDHMCSENGGIANGKTVSADSTDPEKININFIGMNRDYISHNPDFYSDWLHINCIKYNEALDQIAISSPHLDEFYVIDHSTCNYDNPAAGIAQAAGPAGDIVYRWGNPQAYGAGNPEDQKLFFHHNIQWIKPGLPGEGNFLSFNNGFGRPEGNYSSILELKPPVDENGDYFLAPGSAYGPEVAEWVYTDENEYNFYSQIISGAQRLANGNTLICSGVHGKFFEVTVAGEIVWEYINPVSDFGDPQSPHPDIEDNWVFRCYRYAPDFHGLAGKDLTPGKPLEEIVYVEDELPFEFNLFQNYPNPFNLSTSIEFSIPSYGYTSLIIYNVMGQKVRELVAENLSEGTYNYIWDGKDNSGNPVSAGLYITRLKNNDYIMTKRILLLK